MRPRYESPVSIKPHFLAFPILLVLRTVRHVKSKPFPFLTLHAAYICAHSSVFIMYFLLFLTPRYIYAWLFFSVCSVNPFVPHTHAAYICGYSSQSVALFPPIPHSICVSLLSHRQRVKYSLALRPSRIKAQCSTPYAAVALLIARVQRAFRVDKGVLPSVFPIHAAHFCMFISILLRIHQRAEYIDLHLNTAFTPLKLFC